MKAPASFHTCRVLSSPWPGIFGTDIDSTREYDRHWHTTFGFGLMERGAHRSLSGRGSVDAHVGDVITTNPGEVHDGRPLGVASRRWRMVYLDAAAMASVAVAVDASAAEVRLTRPVIRDTTLIAPVRSLLRRLERWTTTSTKGSSGMYVRFPWGPFRRNGPENCPEQRGSLLWFSSIRSTSAALSCEEALVRACGTLLSAHSTARPATDARTDLAQVRDRLADDLVDTPSLSELASTVGISRYQLLRRFERVYGLTPFHWQRQVRLERARAVIGAGSSLAQVALDCGFADQSHMTRAFIAHFGFTPGAWAASRRVGPAERD